MTQTFEVGRNPADIESAYRIRWPFVFLCCLPLIALRVWMLFRPFMLYDFLTYWSAGHQFLTGGHPYSDTTMLGPEQLHGMTPAKPQLMLSPPWMLPFVAVMALPSFRAAQIGWFAITLLLNCFSSLGLWIYFGGEKRNAWIAILIALTFIPMGGAEFMSQITPLILACLTALLLLLRSRRYFAAGVMLLGVGLKPHLLYLVLLAGLLWMIEKRAWTLLAGAVAGYGTATFATVLYNPHSLDYFHHTYSAAIEVPCGVGWVLRSIFGTQHAWLQFLPCLFGFVWFLYYWVKHRRQWDWQVHLPLLLVVSVATSPYCWYHDFILILPALIALAVRGAYRSSSVPVAYLGAQGLIVLAAMLSPAWMCAASLVWIPFYFFADAVVMRKPVEIEANAGVYVQITN
jgi:hypothetical protein